MNVIVYQRSVCSRFLIKEKKNIMLIGNFIWLSKRILVQNFVSVVFTVEKKNVLMLRYFVTDPKSKQRNNERQYFKCPISF